MAKASELRKRLESGVTLSQRPEAIKEVEHPFPYHDDDGRRLDWIVTRRQTGECVLLKGAHSAVEAKRFCLHEVWPEADPAVEPVEVAKYEYSEANGAPKVTKRGGSDDRHDP